MVWRSLEDRFTSKGYYQIDESNGVKNKDKWRSVNKYDRFRSSDPSHYFGALLSFEGDEFSDLDLRTYAGAYTGRQFFATALLDMKVEAGLVYVDEQYGLGDDQDYPGGNWSLNLTSDYLGGLLGGGSRLYLDHDGIANFDEIDTLILNTTLGLGVPVFSGLEFGAEMKFEYDGGVSSELDELERMVSFRLGYVW